jgi:hypothetical protein
MTFDLDGAREADFDRWYDESERPRVTVTRGYLGVQRGVAVRGEPKHALVYDLDSPEPFYTATGYRADGPGVPGLLGWDGDASHALYEQFFPAEGVYQGIEWGGGQTPVGGLRVARLDILPERDKEVNAWYNDEHMPLLNRCPGAIAGRRFKAVVADLAYMSIVYVTDPSVLENPAWAEVSTTPWTRRLVPDAFGARWGARYRTV